MRILLFVAGVAVLGWGAFLLAEFALPLGPQGMVALGWLLGGPLAHDLLVAPIAAVAGMLLVRVVPATWRAPVQVGVAITAVLTLLAFPLLWREFGAAPSPGLHDGDTATGLLLTLVAVWSVVLVTGTSRVLLAARNEKRAAPDEDRIRCGAFTRGYRLRMAGVGLGRTRGRASGVTSPRRVDRRG